MWFGGSRLYVSDWDVGVRCDIYVGVIVWSVKAFHNHTHSLPVVLLKSVYVWILICGKCTHSSSFWGRGSRRLWLDSLFLSNMLKLRHRKSFKLCVCGCATMRTSPLRIATLDLWDSHPAYCVCIVPPFETLMAPAECVTEWVGDNGAGPSC